jgi:hypothetical protein
MSLSTSFGAVAFLLVPQRSEEKHQHAEEPEDAAGDRDPDEQR